MATNRPWTKDNCKQVLWGYFYNALNAEGVSHPEIVEGEAWQFQESVIDHVQEGEEALERAISEYTKNLDSFNIFRDWHDT